jgi:hypothetical protein
MQRDRLHYQLFLLKMARIPRLSGIAWIAIFFALISNSIVHVNARNRKKVLIATMPGGTSHLLEILQVVKHLSHHEVALLMEDWDLDKARSKLPSLLGDPAPPNFLTVSLYDDMADGSKNFDVLVEKSQEESLPVSNMEKQRF